MKMAQFLREDSIASLRDQAPTLSPLKNSTLVVPGGTGFVGKWIAETVATLNDQFGFGMRLLLIARGTDRFQNEAPHLAARSDITLQRSDVRFPFDVPKDTTWVIHAAASPDTRFHSSHPIETFGTISHGTENVFRAVDRCSNIRMVLNISSCMVYGGSSVAADRLREDATTEFGPPSVGQVYGQSKRFGEVIGDAARSEARLPVVTARPFTFFGPYQSIQGPWAFNNFLQDAFSNSPIRVMGDGTAIRSYMYASDMAVWLLRILTGGTSGEVYNVGSPDPISLGDLARRVAMGICPDQPVRFSVAPGTTQRNNRLVPDVTRATERLGLRQAFDFERGFERTLQWYKTK